MNRKLTGHSLVMSAVLFLGFAAGGTAAAESTIIIKGGSHQLAETANIISGFPPTVVNFDDRSTSALGIEYEWRFPKGFTVGAELSGFRHEWTSSIATTGDLATLNFLVNGKKYFAVTKWFNPFVGFGVGAATGDFEGPGGNTTIGGFAAQVMAGIEFRFQQVGIYTEVRHFVAEPEDDYGDDIDVSGTGVYGGLSIHF